jgi:glycolate oxidase
MLESTEEKKTDKKIDKKKEHSVIKEKLEKIVGKDWVSDFQCDLLLYSYDMTENPEHMPDYVVLPRTPEEISEIIKLANEYKIPVVPYATGNNIGGIAIPQMGGIIVDLKRMDQILRVSEDDMYMIVEPGVTWGHVRKFLDENYPQFRYCYPMAPPYSAVVANALQDGLTDLSTRHGCMTEFLNGIEVVLPNGKIARIGTCMIGDEHWWGRVPMPDLLGLFLGWQGMTGIVTKAALKVWPKRPIRNMQFAIFNDLPSTYDFVKRISRTEILNDLLLISMETLKLIQGVPIGEAKHLEGEPRFSAILDFSSNTELEHKAKFELIKSMLKEYKKDDPKIVFSSVESLGKAMGGVVNDVLNLPMTIAGMLEYGGLTWVGTYFPTKTESVLAGAKKAFEIIRKHNFETCLYCRSMESHHYWAFRFLLRFDKGKEGETERMRELSKELFESLFEYGALPYKTPVWAGKMILEHSDPNTVELMKKIRKTMDPNQIMNPGRWGLDEE